MAGKENHIITITSDWGIKDHYLAIAKGQFLSYCPEATWVDISHSIEPFNIAEAAFVLKNSFHFFPKGSWHVIEVSTHTPPDAPYLIMKYKGHFFMGHDDGIFSLIVENDIPDEIYAINNPSKTLFPMRDIYIPVLAQLFEGIDMEKIAHRATSIRQTRPFIASISGDSIKGEIVYIDNYENIFTNIPRSLFEKARGDSSLFTLHIGSARTYYPDLEISENFSNHENSSIVVLFINDYLVVTIKHGNAVGLLGSVFMQKEKDRNIVIEFQKPNSFNPHKLL